MRSYAGTRASVIDCRKLTIFDAEVCLTKLRLWRNRRIASTDSANPGIKSTAKPGTIAIATMSMGPRIQGARGCEQAKLKKEQQPVEH